MSNLIDNCSQLSLEVYNVSVAQKLQIFDQIFYTVCIPTVCNRCGRVIADNIAYAKFRKTLLN